MKLLRILSILFVFGLVLSQCSGGSSGLNQGGDDRIICGTAISPDITVSAATDGSDTSATATESIATTDCVNPSIDEDLDGFENEQDNCPGAFNPSQTDSDGDGVGDSCDNCAAISNADQYDRDLDGIGYSCDDDWDNDGYLNTADNCPQSYNPSQTDADGDGHGEPCDSDDTNPDIHADYDSDGVGDEDDNCPSVANPNQENMDKRIGSTRADDLGDACDDDIDGDGLVNDVDDCDYNPSPDNSCGGTDSDGDGIPDSYDLCPRTANEQNLNVCQGDADGDGILEEEDNCPNVYDLRNRENCGDPSNDRDSDGYANSYDNCPLNPNSSQSNIDGDRRGDVCDEDQDNDNLCDKPLSSRHGWGSCTKSIDPDPSTPNTWYFIDPNNAPTFPSAQTGLTKVALSRDSFDLAHTYTNSSGHIYTRLSGIVGFTSRISDTSIYNDCPNATYTEDSQYFAGESYGDTSHTLTNPTTGIGKTGKQFGICILTEAP